LTPGELNLAIEAHNERIKDEWHRLAWFAGILLAPHNNGRQVDPEKLLPGFITGKRGIVTKEDAKKELEELKKALGVE